MMSIRTLGSNTEESRPLPEGLQGLMHEKSALMNEMNEQMDPPTGPTYQMSEKVHTRLNARLDAVKEDMKKHEEKYYNELVEQDGAQLFDPKEKYNMAYIHKTYLSSMGVLDMYQLSNVSDVFQVLWDLNGKNESMGLDAYKKEWDFYKEVGDTYASQEDYLVFYKIIAQMMAADAYAKEDPTGEMRVTPLLQIIIESFQNEACKQSDTEPLMYFYRQAIMTPDWATLPTEITHTYGQSTLEMKRHAVSLHQSFSMPDVRGDESIPLIENAAEYFDQEHVFSLHTFEPGAGIGRLAQLRQEGTEEPQKRAYEVITYREEDGQGDLVSEYFVKYGMLLHSPNQMERGAEVVVPTDFRYEEAMQHMQPGITDVFERL